ncbi:hypothetical protein [Kitasatospora sp. NPDC004531]
MWDQALPVVFTDGHTASVGAIDRGRTLPERIPLPWLAAGDAVTWIHLVAGPGGALTVLRQSSSSSVAPAVARMAPNGSAVRELPGPPGTKNRLHALPGGPLTARRETGTIGAPGAQVLVFDEPDEKWQVLTTLESGTVNWIDRGTVPGRLLLAGTAHRHGPDRVGLLAEVELDSGRWITLDGPPKDGRLRRRLFGPAVPEEFRLAVAARGFVVAVEESGYFWTDRDLHAYSHGPKLWSTSRFRRGDGVFQQELVRDGQVLLLGDGNRFHSVDDERRRWSSTDLTRRLAATTGGPSERPRITGVALHGGELWLGVTSSVKPDRFADCVVAVSLDDWSAELVHHCPAGERTAALAQRPS